MKKWGVIGMSMLVILVFSGCQFSSETTPITSLNLSSLYADEDFIPGDGGEMLPLPVFEEEEGHFGGLYISKVERDKDWFSTFNVLEIIFPEPTYFEGEGYTLEYRTPEMSEWIPYQVLGTNLTTTEGHLRIRINEGMSLRLKISGGPLAGFTSNEVSFTLPGADTYFSDWDFGHGDELSVIEFPFEGYGIQVTGSVKDLDANPITGYLAFQWYRVNPKTFEMFEIEGENSLLYLTTPSDVGYYLLFKASGDNIHVGGFKQLLYTEGVFRGNETFATNATETSFTLNFYKMTEPLNKKNLYVIDQSFFPIPIVSISQGANQAIYHVILDDVLGTPTSFIIAYAGQGWIMGGRTGDEEGLSSSVIAIVGD